MAYRFDPELAAVIPMLPTLDFTNLAAVRAFLAEVRHGQQRDTTGVDVRDVRVPGPPDAPDVSVRVYRPAPAGTAGRTGVTAGLLHIHGGGFMIGNRGVDPTRIAVRGTSAGAGLAAGLALLTRDRGGPPLCFQFLTVPELDDRLDTPSMRRFVDTPVLNRPNAVISWNAYLGEGIPGTPDVSPYAAPARATDLTGLPPAYISVMEVRSAARRGPRLRPSAPGRRGTG